MKKTYKGSIERGKIDQSAIYTNNEGRQFLQIVFTVDNENEDQYGNVGSIRQDLGKDRRDDPAVWLGKVKPLGARNASRPAAQPAKPLPTRPAPVAAERQAMQTTDDGEGYIPF